MTHFASRDGVSLSSVLASNHGLVLVVIHDVAGFEDLSKVGIGEIAKDLVELVLDTRLCCRGRCCAWSSAL